MPNQSETNREDVYDRGAVKTNDGSVTYPASAFRGDLMPPNWHVKTDKEGNPRWTTA